MHINCTAHFFFFFCLFSFNLLFIRRLTLVFLLSTYVKLRRKYFLFVNMGIVRSRLFSFDSYCAHRRNVGIQQNDGAAFTSKFRPVLSIVAAMLTNRVDGKRKIKHRMETFTNQMDTNGKLIIMNSNTKHRIALLVHSQHKYCWHQAQPSILIVFVLVVVGREPFIRSFFCFLFMIFAVYCCSCWLLCWLSRLCYRCYWSRINSTHKHTNSLDFTHDFSTRKSVTSVHKKKKNRKS